MKVKSCTCKHCRDVKSKRKNRKLKKKIKRLLNKRRRKAEDLIYINYYWV